jgi:hypothetical protein
MAPRARIRGHHALASRTSGKTSLEFENRDFNISIKIRRCRVLKTRLEESTRSNFVGQPHKLQVRSEKLKPIAGQPSKRLGSACECSYIDPPWSWGIVCFTDDIDVWIVCASLRHLGIFSAGSNGTTSMVRISCDFFYTNSKTVDMTLPPVMWRHAEYGKKQMDSSAKLLKRSNLLLQTKHG